MQTSLRDELLIVGPTLTPASPMASRQGTHPPVSVWPRWRDDTSRPPLGTSPLHRTPPHLSSTLRGGE